jgi:hypothetical protein
MDGRMDTPYVNVQKFLSFFLFSFESHQASFLSAIVLSTQPVNQISHSFHTVVHKQHISFHSFKMPVPRRRQQTPMETLANLPSLTLQLLNADFVFQKTKWLFYTVLPQWLFTWV